MEVNVHHAKTHLSKLISAAESGEEVIIARNGKPAVRMVPVAVATKPRREMWGAWEGKIALPTDAEWKAMDKEIEDEMVNGPIFPAERS